ncbi:hypothetical protein FRC07_005467, partial [Ceratobasidium sp. 392]
MRFFSPFAILGLLHVARGGELDAFASDRARNARERLASQRVPVVDTSNTTSAIPRSELPNAFKRELERRETHERALDQLDTNKDGHVDHDEIIGYLAVHWKGEHNARRMLRAFGFSNMEEHMRSRSVEGDGRISKETLTEILDTRPIDKPDYCPAIRTKVESCSMHSVLKCGAYLNAAESLCNAGVQNMVEKCIMSESCDNMCTCIAAVEEASHGNGVIVYQGQTVPLDQLGLQVGHPETGLQTRQLELLGLFLWALIEFLVGITVAIIAAQIYDSLTSANPWMDTHGTETNPSPRVALSYSGAVVVQLAVAKRETARMALNECLAIRAKIISATVARVAVSLASAAKVFAPSWSEFDNQDMPGSDMDKGSFFTSKVSVCRNACAGNSTCQAFVIAPFSGNEKDKRPNCFLKTAQRQTQTVDGSTVFFKRDANGNCGSPTSVSGVPYDDDWFSTSTGTDRRSLIEPGHSALLPRAHKGEVPFPFDRSVAGYLTLALISLIYQRITSELTWRNNQFIQRPIGNTRAATNGPGPGRPASENLPYLSNLALPQWRPTEIAYRVNGMFRNIINTAITQNVDDPVARWLNQNPSTTAGQRAQFPDSVRQLLLANSAVVHDVNRGNGQTWIGQDTRFTPGGLTAPFNGTRAGYDQGMTFYQRGNAGPFSLEAAFLMATQLAGINFRAVARSYQTNPAGWWMGAINTGPNTRGCLQEHDTAGVATRTYGRFESAPGSAEHDARAGVYMAFDLDPSLSNDDPNHNVFVFVVHALDANSVVGSTDAQLRAVNVGNSNNWYPAASTKADARFWNQGSSSTTMPTANARSNTRLLAHAHAAIVSRAELESWLTGTR